MKTFRLLPGYFKIIGLLMVIPGAILGAMTLYGEFEFPWLDFKIREKDEFLLPAVENFTNELAFFLIIAGLLFLVFSREKEEDERVQQIRLEAFQWSFLVHFVLVIIANWFMFSENFFFVLIYGMFTPLLVFLGRFYYVLKIKEAPSFNENEGEV
ncbi:MAG: hypothetical protein R2792_17960 [Saprospiraceae bacterium]